MAPIASSDLPSLSSSYVDLESNQQIAGNKRFTGLLSGNGYGLTNIKGTFNWEEVTGASVNANSNSGYVVNNSLEVVITLPASPAVGDVVRITGAGSGGWQIVSNNQQSLFALSQSIAWTSAWSSAYWQALAVASNGSIIAAGNGLKITGNVSMGPV